MSEYRLDYLEQLETESIHIFREIAGQFERPVLLFSGGKDSITLVHLAKKAFAPGKIPFPLVQGAQPMLINPLSCNELYGT